VVVGNGKLEGESSASPVVVEICTRSVSLGVVGNGKPEEVSSASPVVVEICRRNAF
jgi:hypothetical protein